MRGMLAVLLIGLLGCGGVSFRGTFRSGNTVFSVSGFVSIIELTTLPGTTIPVTIVTFLPDFGPGTTVIFCGNLTQQFFVAWVYDRELYSGVELRDSVGHLHQLIAADTTRVEISRFWDVPRFP
jgi:hypothetical protein